MGNALAHSREMSQEVHWHQLRTVLEGLALSAVLGFLLAGGLWSRPGSTTFSPIRDSRYTRKRVSCHVAYGSSGLSRCFSSLVGNSGPGLLTIVRTL